VSATDGGRVRRLERMLFILGLTCLAWCGVIIAKATWFQAEQRAVLSRMPPPVSHFDDRLTSRSSQAPSLIGELKIPRVKLSAIVVEGDDDDTLNVAVGHLPDTPLPWQDGNSALAGHRDTFFRPLKGVRTGDEIRLTTPHGHLRYRVERTRIVDPDDLSVLDRLPKPSLTLITCFPFSYIGNAPQRFIVQANRIGSESS
jgi:sortase A